MRTPGGASSFLDIDFVPRSNGKGSVKLLSVSLCESHALPFQDEIEDSAWPSEKGHPNVEVMMEIIISWVTRRGQKKRLGRRPEALEVRNNVAAVPTNMDRRSGLGFNWRCGRDRRSVGV